MSQTPNTTNPTTAEDFVAQKALLSAQADVLDAQARLIASQKALQKAQSGDDQLAMQLAAATQAANIAAQKKIVSESQATILKTNFAVPDSGYTGTVTAGDKAGKIEASILAAEAVAKAAHMIVDRIKNKVHDKSVVLYGGSDLPDFQSLIVFDSQYKTIDKALDDAISMIDEQLPKAEKLPSAQADFATPAMIGAGLDAANKILGFFRTDYTIQGVEVTPDDRLLISALAGVLCTAAKEIKLPALFNAPALLDDSAIVADISKLTIKRLALQQKADLAAADVDILNNDAKNETDAKRKSELLAVANGLKTASDRGKAALSLYDGLLTKLTTPDDKAKVPLAAIVQQAAVRDALKKDGALLITAKMSSAGGSYYTKKDIWSFLGLIPFFVRGGVVVEFILFDGKTGLVHDAGAVPLDGGFFKVSELPTALKPVAAKNSP